MSADDMLGKDCRKQRVGVKNEWISPWGSPKAPLHTNRGCKILFLKASVLKLWNLPSVGFVHFPLTTLQPVMHSPQTCSRPEHGSRPSAKHSAFTESGQSVCGMEKVKLNNSCFNLNGSCLCTIGCKFLPRIILHLQMDTWSCNFILKYCTFSHSTMLFHKSITSTSVYVLQ